MKRDEKMAKKKTPSEKGDGDGPVTQEVTKGSGAVSPPDVPEVDGFLDDPEIEELSTLSLPRPRKTILSKYREDFEALKERVESVDPSSLGTVMIAAPVRNRGYIMDSYLKSLSSLDFPDESIGFYFVLNDSVDHTESMLVRYQDAVNDGRRKFRFFEYDTVNLNAPLDYRIKGVRFGGRGYRGIIDYLARYRNKILKKFRESGMDFLLTVDSDTTVSPHILKWLITADKPVISAFVDVDFGRGRIGNMMRWEYDPKRGRQRLKHIQRAEPGIIPVDSTGGVVLIRKEVAEAKVRYFTYPPGQDAAGEDAGFVRSAQEAGFEVFCLVGEELAVHHMANMNHEVFYRDIGVLPRD